MATARGQSIRFNETDLRDQGRATRGVRGIKLKSEDDKVVAIEIVRIEKEAAEGEEASKELLLIAGANGLGKRTDFLG